MANTTNEPWGLSVGPRDSLLLYFGHPVAVITDASMEKRIFHMLNVAERRQETFAVEHSIVAEDEVVSRRAAEQP